MAVISYREALNQAMREEMERDPTSSSWAKRSVTTTAPTRSPQGLLQRFSERRVVDTPIAEMGFAGIGVGAAMVGLRPIIEFMTWNFSLVAIDQIVNSAAKMFQMSGGQFNIPIVFRGPSGPAVQVGSQHSQALESWYAHVPGLSVVTPSTPADAKGLLKTAIRDDNPVVFMEGETLYGMTGEVPDGELLIPLGKATSSGPARTSRWWRGRAWSTSASRQPRSWPSKASTPRSSTRGRSGPLDVPMICDSVRKTGRCVIVEVGWPQAGFGAEVAYQVQRQCLDALDAPVERVCSDDVPMPYAKNLEDEVQPQVKDVVAAVRRTLYLDA
jgi:pyruvate dehydrogenase E1 component beta subunit